MKYLGKAGLEHIKERTYDAYSGKPRPWRPFGGKHQKWVKVHTLTLLAMIDELEETILQRDHLLMALEVLVTDIAGCETEEDFIIMANGFAVEQARDALAGAQAGG